VSTAGIAIEREGAIASLRFDRPQRRNALTAEMYATLAQALDDAGRDAAVRVVLFEGSAEAFTAGNDIEDFARRPPEGEEAPVFRFLQAVAAARKPLVAAVEGVAVGIGTTLLLHCDLVYAGDKARFSMPFTRLGLVPEFASSYLLPLAAGYHRAAEMLLLGEPFGAAQALEAGIVTRVVASGGARDAALDAARRLAALPAEPVRLTKELLKAAHADAIRAQLDRESAQFRRLLHGPAAREALAAFLEKRPADFSHCADTL